MSLSSFFRTFTSAAGDVVKKSLSSFCFIETAVGDTLVGKDGSLASIIRVDGIKQIMGPDELNSLVADMNIKMSSYFSTPGHAMQVWFCRDPDLSHDLIKAQVLPARNVAKKLNLNLDDLFAERESYLPQFITWEGFYIVLWTRLSSLTKYELGQARLEAKPPKAWPTMADAQNIHRPARSLDDRHLAFVSSFMADLGSVGIRASVLDGHEAIAAVRSSIYPDLIGGNWRPYLPGDKIPLRFPENGPFDGSHGFWPRVEDQIFDREAERVNSRIVRIGMFNYGSINMTIGPQDVMPFTTLLQRMMELNEFPWRVSFLIEGDGLGSMMFKGLLASLFAFSNSENRPIRDAINGLKEYQLSDNAVIVKFRVSFATWAPSDSGNLIEQRLSRLQRAVESWGYCGTSSTLGDPLAGVFSSTLGLDVASTAPAGTPPLSDVVYMLPWARDASPWKNGSVLFRTPDGRPWPYQPGSSKQATFIDLIFAPPGMGKSVYMNTTNLALCLSAASTSGTGGAQLPRIAIIDIGPSSAGVISLLKEALPQNKRYQAAYHRLRMDKDNAINPFDTQLGCRHPLQLERSFLINFLSLLGTSAGRSYPPDGLSDIAGVAVDTLYEMFSDRSKSGNPKPYTEGENALVDEAIRKYNLKIEEDESWWQIVDKLYEQGAIHEANVAQRYAVPLLEDLTLAIRTTHVENIYGSAITESGESVIKSFERMISTALREYPILTVPTRFDLGDARVVALDLDEVAPRGGAAADKQTALMYMLARFVLAKDFYLNDKLLPHIPEDYRSYHRQRIKRIAESPKRIVYDEFHRTTSAAMVREQVLIDMREGRKWGVHIALLSQLIEDFDESMIEMATGVWIMGVGNEKAANRLAETFGLSRTALNIIKHNLKGPRPGGAPFLALLSLKEGTHEHLLFNTLGPTEMWAFSTTAEDAALRNRLYDILGAVESRRRLAKRFPSGTAKTEIERRVEAAMEMGQDQEGLEDGIIDALVQEIINLNI